MVRLDIVWDVVTNELQTLLDELGPFVPPPVKTADAKLP